MLSNPRARGENDVPFRNDDLAIEKKLRVEDFRLLQEKFTQTSASDVEQPKNSPGKMSLLVDVPLTSVELGFLTKDEFLDVFGSFLDLVKYSNQLEKLFDKVASRSFASAKDCSSSSSSIRKNRV